MIKIIFSTAVAVALITLTSQYLRQVESDFVQQLLQDSEQAETMHVFHQFSLAYTDETGRMESLLRSPKTRYIVNEQKTYLSSPTMLVYRKQQAPVTLSAESAIVDHLTNVTTLQNNVDVSVIEPNKTPLRMTTDFLEIDKTSQVASTTAPARIYYGNSRMDGTGLEFDLEKKRIKFLDKVHGFYEH